MKDPLNCPYCEAEEKGYSIGWSGSDEFWEEMEERHLREHLTESKKQYKIKK